MKTPEIKPQEYYKILDGSEVASNETEFQVTFRVTDNCNLKCEYCHWNDEINYNITDIKKSVYAIYNFLLKEKIKSVLFYMHGGEPTAHPQILEVLEYIRYCEKDLGVKTVIEMQTNLACKNDVLEDIIPLIDLIDISYHHVELHKKKLFPKFIDNYNYLKIINYPITSMDIMMENVEDLDSFYYAVEKILEYDGIQNSEMIYGFCHYEKNQETYDKHIEFYKKHNKTEQRYEIDGVVYNTNELFQKGLDCRDWKCEAGQKSITINGDGNVFNCGIHMTNFTNRCIETKPFTNLITDASAIKKMSILHKTGTKCKWDYCGGDFYLGRSK